METTDLKWCHSQEGEIYESDYFDTRDAAIADAKKNYYTGGYCEFYIAQAEKYRLQININNILDVLNEQAYADSGECEEDCLNLLSLEDTEKLETRLQAVFDEWVEETGNKPNFYTIVDTEIIRIDDYPEGEVNKNETMHMGTMKHAKSREYMLRRLRPKGYLRRPLRRKL